MTTPAATTPSSSGNPVVDTALLRRLLDAQGPTTVQSLAGAMGVPASRIAGELERLRLAGCTIDTHPQLGVRLTAAGLGVWVDHLQAVLGGSTEVVVYRTTASTQDAARKLIEARGASADGGLVIADHQSAGRGRLGRKWVAAPGACLMVSRACRSDLPGAGVGVDRLTLITAVAAARALDRFLRPVGHSVALKWPNDLMLGGAKLGGILVESFHDARGGPWAVAGIGINVQPITGVDDRPVTSLAEASVRADRLVVLTELAERWAEAVGRGATGEVLDEWRARCRTLHQELRVRCGGVEVTGTVLDLDPDAGLILRDHDGVLRHLPAATTTVL